MNPLPTLADITALVAAHYGLPEADLVGKRRVRSVSEPRQLAVWLATQCTRYSHQDIAAALGQRDRSTVSYAARVVQQRMEKDGHLALVGRTLKQRLKNQGEQRAS